MAQEVAETKGGALDRMDQETRDAVNDLGRDSTHGAGDHRLSFPHPFRDGQSETLSKGFLQNDRGRSLKGVDLPITIRGQRKDEDIRVSLRGFLDLGQHLGAFGIVRRAPSGQHQLAVEVGLDQAVGGDDPQRILEAIEARDLHEEGTLGVDRESLQHLRDRCVIHVAVLLAQGIDRGRDQHFGHRHPLRKLRDVEDGHRIFAHGPAQESPDMLLRTRQVDVATPDGPLLDGGKPVDQVGRLRIMHHDDIRVQGQCRRVLFEDLPVHRQF